MNVDGHPATLSYRILDDSTLEYYSTEVSEALRGRGVGGRLARYALDYADEHGYKVVPTCSFIAKFLERNKDYTHLRAEHDGREAPDQE